MAVLVQSPPIDFVTDLVNNWADAVHHDPAPPEGRPYPSRTAVFEGHGVRLDPAVSDADLAKIADHAYPIFAAPTDERLDLANEFIGTARLQPILERSAGLWWVADEGRAIVANVAAALLLHARSDPTLARFGACTAHRCRDAYIDTSQGRTRRFCSERCQTRAKARRRRS